MDPLRIIETLYRKHTRAYRILVRHGQQVAAKALSVAGRMAHLGPDTRFIQQAAMLHDIGMIFTRAADLGCRGRYAYVCHGHLGHQFLVRHGLRGHALVCERHVGVGLSAAEIRRRRLPMPVRDMLPVSLEEQIICYADKFYSKNAAGDGKPKSIEQIMTELNRFGREKAARFETWAKQFGDR
jgi:uncharacterized protein